MSKLAGLFVTTLSLFLLVIGCGGGGSGSSGQEEEEGQPSSAQEEEGLVVGEFVGEVPNTDAFLALIAEGPDNAQDAEERNIWAFLCDGKQLSEWFVGTTNGNSFQLTSSENSFQLQADLYPDNATGSILLPSVENFGFQAPLAQGGSGFYPVSVPVLGGSFSTTSFSGAQLEGTRGAPEEISGTITPPDNGEAQEFTVSDPNLEEGEDRWIVLSEEGQLRIKGSKRQATSSGFIDPTTGLKNPGFINATTNL